jgi:hypothetical protein
VTDTPSYHRSFLGYRVHTVGGREGEIMNIGWPLMTVCTKFHQNHSVGSEVVRETQMWT